MEPIQKLHQISPQMYLEPAEEVGDGLTLQPRRSAIDECGIPLHESTKTSALGIQNIDPTGGNYMRLLKTMLTTACERNCAYCPFRAGRDYRRVNFTPDELAKTVLMLHEKRVVRGLFLSSGILKGGVTTQDKLIDTVEILRNKHEYKGRIHVKLMPGVERDQVLRVMQLTDRVSINLEAPTREHLKMLAPMKKLIDELLTPLRWAHEIRRYHAPHKNWQGKWPTIVTQFVVGAAQDSDLEYLKATDYLYRKAGVWRAYYSAFTPIRDTPFENVPYENPVRQQRLYQASYMLRDYGWQVHEIPLGKDNRMALDVDPKLAWARLHLLEKPLELNRARKAELLRVPGIGVISAEKILKARRTGKIKSLKHLEQLGIHTKRLKHFILLDGVQPDRQMRLF